MVNYNNEEERPKAVETLHIYEIIYSKPQDGDGEGPERNVIIN